MKALILGEHDVARLLPMDECVEVMAEALEALERGEMHQPLRFVVRPPDAAGLLGLMPAHRSGASAAFGLKAVCVMPGNPARGLDAHQGVVILSDGETGEVRAVVNASAITAIRTAAVSAVATRLLARDGARELAVLGAGVQARSHLAAMAVARDFEVARIWSRTPAHAEAVAAEAGTPFPVEVVGSAEEAVAAADVICTTTSAPEPILRRDWLRDGAHVNAVGSSIPTTRELDTATMAAASPVRRPPRVDRERGWRLPLPAAGGRHRPRAHPRRARRAPGGARRGPHVGRRAHGLQVPRPRGRGPRRRRARLPPRARDGHRHRGRPLIPLEDIRRAREVLAGTAVRTPLVRLHVEDAPAEIYLKLENLQPINSFKIRGAYNAMSAAPREELARGVLTTSAGNMAQGVGWAARELGIPCTVIVPDHAPQTKLDAIERLGGTYVKVPFDRWWQALEERSYPGVEGFFVHPVEDEPVMAGNGTIGLELLEDLPDVDTVIVPWGGGGLFTGIASAVKALRPETSMRVVELETSAPLTASVAAGEPREIDYQPSFVDGAGARALLPKMWGLGRPLLDGTDVVTLEETAAAVRLLVERARVVAEGAGALAVASALSGRSGGGKIVAIVSGGNIDSSVLATILAGKTP